MKKTIEHDSFLGVTHSLFSGIMRKFFSPPKQNVTSFPLLFFWGSRWICPLSAPGKISLRDIEKNSFYLGTPARQIQENIFDGKIIALQKEREKIQRILLELEEKNCLHLASEEFLKMAMIFLVEGNMSAAVKAAEDAVSWGENPSMPTENLHRMTDLVILESFRGSDKGNVIFTDCVEKWVQSKKSLGISAFPHFYNLVAHRVQTASPPDDLFRQSFEQLGVMHRNCLHPRLPFATTVSALLEEAQKAVLPCRVAP